MIEIQDNIWSYYDCGYWITVTTNGTVRKDGACVMGRGTALQAKNRFTKLPYVIGRHIKSYGNIPMPSHEYRIITFPVKYHWAGKADLLLIEDSCFRLVVGMTLLDLPFLFMTRPGCNNGGLEWKDVKPILEKYLDDRYIICDLQE